MIRERIIHLYIEHGAPVPLVDVAKRLGLSLNSIELQLRETEKINDLRGLDVRQAHELIQYYGEDFLFTSDIVETVEQYLDVRHKLDVIEQKAQGGKGPKSGTDGP